MYIYIYIYIYMHICMYVCIYIYIYIYTHTGIPEYSRYIGVLAYRYRHIGL